MFATGKEKTRAYAWARYAACGAAANSIAGVHKPRLRRWRRRCDGAFASVVAPACFAQRVANCCACAHSCSALLKGICGLTMFAHACASILLRGRHERVSHVFGLCTMVTRSCALRLLLSFCSRSPRLAFATVSFRRWRHEEEVRGDACFCPAQQRTAALAALSIMTYVLSSSLA
jgi:hypothetical protein